MKRHSFLAAAVLVALVAGPAAAQENEAEKLFRGMEQKVRAAKTLQIRFELSITDALGKKGNVKGSLILGEGDKYRAEAEGKLFGQAVKFSSESDGTNVKSVGDSLPKEDKPEMSPKGSGAYFRGALPCEGFFLSSLEMDRRRDRAPDTFKLADFKLTGKEQIGARNTQVIQYTVTIKDAKDPTSMKIWLDAKTNLPVKLAMTGGKSDVADVTETYSEFTIDAKVEARLFELPKVAPLTEASAGTGKATQKDQEKIQGTWEPSSLSIGGQATRLQPKDLPRLIFTGARVVTKDPGTEEQEATFKLHAEKEPKHIDMTNKKEGKTVQGIYLLDGDTLKIAYRFPAAGRPTTFDSKDVFMKTLQRQIKK